MIYSRHRGKAHAPRVLDEQLRREIAAFEGFTRNVMFVASTQEDWATEKRRRKMRRPR